MAKDTGRPKYVIQFEEWVGEIDRWGKNKCLWEYGEDYTRVRIFTDGHEYSIRATPTYLGCIVNSRKPRPGEDWNRGNDLQDGKYSRETWYLILCDIVAYELKTISFYILNPPTEIAEETMSSDIKLAEKS